jgi:2-dehydro-3-deoxygluconokinase
LSYLKKHLTSFDLKPARDCRWDLVSLGEVMLRFDPGDRRIRNAREFYVWEGGGEYNVARNLASTFRYRSAIVTALADNEIGRLIEDLIRQGGVDASLIRWVHTDSISKAVRNGLYFWERGYGGRAPSGFSDRANTAVSQITSGEIDWETIFAKDGARWFHTGGIFASLSERSPVVVREAFASARESGAIVSYDLNFRPSLWNERGGRSAADELNRRLLPFVDVAFGTLGFNPSLEEFDPTKFAGAAAAMMNDYPNLKVVCTTLRTVHHASIHDLSGAIYDGSEVFTGPVFTGVNVLDRVGSGDAFAAGVIYELLSGRGLKFAVTTGTSAAVLAMTTPGDGLAASLNEVVQFADFDQHSSR